MAFTSHSVSMMSSLISDSSKIASNSTKELSLMRSDPALDEIDTFLTQLKYKLTFQDEDSIVYPSGSVLHSPEVSRAMANFVGVEKQELKSETRMTLASLEKFYREYLKATKVNNGSKALELLQELFFTPEYVAFQQVLCNSPKEWVERGLPVIQDKVKMEVVVDQIQKEVQDLQLSRRELAKNIRLGEKDLEKVKSEREKKVAKMSGDNGRRLRIALESFKEEADKLEVIYSRSASSVKDNDVTELLSKFEEMLTRHKVAKEELSKLSPHNALPPDITGAATVVLERKAYLEALMDQIKSPMDLSNLDNSVFSSSM